MGHVKVFVRGLVILSAILVAFATAIIWMPVLLIYMLGTDRIWKGEY